MNLSESLLLLFGLAIFGGMFGGYVSQRLRIPQVVGYIAVGLLLGQSGLNLVDAGDIETLESVNLFALGIIGFLVGGELELESFRRYGKQFSWILVSEGLAAFLLVGGSTFFMLSFVGGLSLPAALAAAILFGAIASATDPASTIDVLWEQRAKGVLALSLTAIVALDDALAMALYGFGTTAAQIIAGGEGSFLVEFERVAVELGGALVLGALFALLMTAIFRAIHEPERISVVAIGLVFLLVSLAAGLGMDIILASMVFGFVTRNLAPHRSSRLFTFLQSVSTVIYVLFFVFVGARINLANMPFWLWGTVAVYVLFRTLGKWGGAMLGARIAGSEPVVRRYLGMGLLSQGGVAIGLAIVASQRLGHIVVAAGASLGDLIISGITASTLIVQLIGPPFVKFAVTRAKENNRRITEEDAIAQTSLQEVMTVDMPVVSEGTSLKEAIDLFGNSNADALPVVDQSGAVRGYFTLDSFKEVLSDRDSWSWLLVSDTQGLREPAVLRSDRSVAEAYRTMMDSELESLVVVDASAPARLVGIVELRKLRSTIRQKLLAAA